MAARAAEKRVQWLLRAQAAASVQPAGKALGLYQSKGGLLQGTRWGGIHCLLSAKRKGWPAGARAAWGLRDQPLYIERGAPPNAAGNCTPLENVCRC